MPNTDLRHGDWSLQTQAETAGGSVSHAPRDSGKLPSAERRRSSPVVADSRQRGSSLSENPPSRSLRLSSRNRSSVPTDGNPAVLQNGRKSRVRLRSDLNVATWNVRIMRRDGKIETFEREMRNLGVGLLGICETRWTGVGEFLTDEGSTVIYSGGIQHEAGVGVILNKTLSRSLLGYRPINERIISSGLLPNRGT